MMVRVSGLRRIERFWLQVIDVVVRLVFLIRRYISNECGTLLGLMVLILAVQLKGQKLCFSDLMMMPRSPFIQMRKPVAEAFGPRRELQSVNGPHFTSRHRAGGALSGDGIECRGDRRAVGGLWHETQLPASTTRVSDETRGAWLVPLSVLTLYRLCPRDLGPASFAFLSLEVLYARQR